MSFHKTFIFVTYLTVITGILSLSLAEGSPTYIFLGLIGSITIWYFHEKKSIVKLTRGAATTLSVFAFIYMLIEIFYMSGYVVLSFTHFLIIIQLIKLCLDKDDRDYTQIFLISFMHLIVTSVLTTNIIFAILFIIYIIVTTWTLILFHLKTENNLWQTIPSKKQKSNKSKDNIKLLKQKYPQYNIHQKNFINHKFFLSTGFLTVIILLLTSLIFIMIPRYSAGLFISKLGRMSKISGFSSKVNLNSIGSIKLDYTPVMRLELQNQLGGFGKNYLIKGIAFDHYSHGWWKKMANRQIQFYSGSVGDIYPLTGAHYAWMDSIVQKFTIEELDTRILFHISPLKKINSKFKRINTDISDTIFTPYPYYRGAQYHISSGLVPEYDTPPNVSKTKSNYRVISFLDKKSINKEVFKLTNSIINKPEFGDNPFIQARAIEKYLIKNYSYTLENPSGGTKEPVTDFLLNSKAGHCEYFATAMALMLRTIGIPSRYVNGFQANEWNDIGEYYIIRNRDAHSWVEAYFSSIGWYPFDPTPPIHEEASGIYKYTYNTKFGKYLDMMQMKWREWVINYTFDRQKKAVKKLRRKTRNIRNQILKTVTHWRLKAQKLPISKHLSLKNIFWALAGLIFFGVLAHISYQYFKTTNLFKELLKRKIKISVKFYAEFIRIMKNKGFYRNPNQTPFEFINNIYDFDDQDYNDVFKITELFYKVRYGNKKLQPNEINQITDIIYRLKYEKAKS